MRLERGADMVRERRGSGWREVRKKREKDKGTSEEKAREIPEAIRKGKEDAMKKLIEVPIDENNKGAYYPRADWGGGRNIKTQ